MPYFMGYTLHALTETISDIEFRQVTVNKTFGSLPSLISIIPLLHGKLICHYSGLHESAESDQPNLIKLGVDLHLLTPQTW